MWQGLAPESLDPGKGLTETNVVTLAVIDNPRLQAARLEAGVARAQLLEAGLLPNPHISGGLSKSSFLTGYRSTLAEDIQALISRRDDRSAAKAHLEQVNLDILWQPARSPPISSPGIPPRLSGASRPMSSYGSGVPLVSGS
ncbi:MAG: hypothetical protein ACREV7_18220 [Steroidobacteraceae bacterium]